MQGEAARIVIGLTRSTSLDYSYRECDRVSFSERRKFKILFLCINVITIKFRQTYSGAVQRVA